MLDKKGKNPDPGRQIMKLNTDPSDPDLEHLPNDGSGRNLSIKLLTKRCKDSKEW
jgi:hypothetical protein